MKRKDIRIGQSYYVKQYGGCNIALVTDLQKVLKTKRYRWHPDTYEWRVTVNFVHFDTDENGDVTWEISSWREKLTLQQIESPVEIEDVAKARQANAKAKMQERKKWELVRETGAHKELAERISELYGIKVRTTYSGNITIEAAEIAEWKQRQLDKQQSLKNLGLLSD